MSELQFSEKSVREIIYLVEDLPVNREMLAAFQQQMMQITLPTKPGAADKDNLAQWYQLFDWKSE